MLLNVSSSFQWPCDIAQVFFSSRRWGNRSSDNLNKVVQGVRVTKWPGCSWNSGLSHLSACTFDTGLPLDWRTSVTSVGSGRRVSDKRGKNKRKGRRKNPDLKYYNKDLASRIFSFGLLESIFLLKNFTPSEVCFIYFFNLWVLRSWIVNLRKAMGQAGRKQVWSLQCFSVLNAP